jgi:hypothetical protein
MPLTAKTVDAGLTHMVFLGPFETPRGRPSKA